MNETTTKRRPAQAAHKLRWSVLLTVLVGMCSFSAPHLLSHAHAHHTSTGNVSRSSGPSHRSRTASGAEHDSGQAHSSYPTDPRTPSHIAPLLAILDLRPALASGWISVGTVVQQDASFTTSPARSSYRGRAPPLA